MGCWKSTCLQRGILSNDSRPIEIKPPHARPELLDLFNIVRLPGLIEEGFGWAIEAQKSEPSSTRDSGDPVLSSSGRLWAEVDVGRTVRILDRFVHGV